MCGNAYQFNKVCRSLMLFVIMALSPIGCFRSQTKIVINVEAQDESGGPIEGAEVFLGERIIGFTDERGKLSATQNVYGARVTDLVVRKQTGTSYYSEFRQSISIEGKSQEEFGINARMYHVEKAALSSTQSPPPAPVSSETPTIPSSSATSPVVESKEADAKASDAPKSELPSAPIAQIVGVAIPSLEASDSNTRIRPDLKSFEKFKHPERNKLAVNVYVENGKNVLADAHVRYLVEGDTEFTDGCQTNRRGRCAITLGVAPGTEIRLIVSARGFQTQARQIRLTSKMKEKFLLREMQSIDFFTLLPSYGSMHAVPGVEILVEGEKKGVTDRYGHFVLKLTPDFKPDTLVELKSQDMVPDKIKLEDGVAGAGVLSESFRRLKPELPKVALIPAKIMNFSGMDMSAANQKFPVLLKKNLFRRGLMQQRNFIELERAAEFADKTFNQLLVSGWKGLRTNIDFAIEPLVLTNKQSSTVELRVIDSSGSIVAGTVAEIGLDGGDHRQLDQQFALFADRLFESIPFELTIKSASTTHISVSLQEKLKDLVRVGDSIWIYGDSRKSRSEDWQPTQKGSAQIEKIEGLTVSAKISNRTESAEVRPGDYVKIGSLTSSVGSVRELLVTSAQGKTGVARASVYWNEKWLGTTDSDGRFRIPPGISSGQILVVDGRHQPYKSLANFAGTSQMQIILKDRMSYAQIDSEPRGAEVWLSGEKLGKTPLYTAIPSIAESSAELAIKGPNGYRVANQMLKAPVSDIDFTGAKRVSLEKDVLSFARSLIENGQYQEAVSKLEMVSEEHSDFLFAQNEIGKLFLTRLSNPDLAIKAFQRITDSRDVKDFKDPRFTPTFLNLGIAKFVRAKTYQISDTSESARELRSAFDLFRSIAGHVGDFPEDLAEMANHSIGFYTAMSAQKLAEISGSEVEEKVAKDAWKNYASLIARVPPTRDDTKEMQKASDIYLSSLLKSSSNESTEISH
jgi:hypothetical protein